MSRRGYISGLVFAVALASRCIPAQQPTNAVAQQVSAFVEDDHVVPMIMLARAKDIATEMFRSASVKLDWPAGAPPRDHRTMAPGCPPAKSRPVIVVVRFLLSGDGPPQREGVLAYTYPYARSDARINILYDRLRPGFAQHPERNAAFLAHIIVHEMTHVLQRVSRHSDDGVMKARWTSRDYAAMDNHPLAFAPDDIELIRLGLISWRRESCQAGRYVDLLSQNPRR